MIKLNQLSFSEYDLNEILKSSQANKLVLFIGAGFSKFSETELVKLPTWEELINELKDDLMLSKENDFLKIAQLYFLKHGQHSYVKKIKSTIKDLEPSSFHKSLFELNPRYIITTNWDNLLEKTSQNMGLAYDIVGSDIDLAQSHLDKKIIKMHGDFRQNNFVFKEDDYLQYSHNFPLIENFIKGIFSTSTVIFLGYSYSDYNLKQIISWITTISKATPRKFLLQKTYDDAQALYLKNHGISLLTPINTDINYHDLYLQFFNDLKIIQDPNELIKKTINSAELEIEKTNKNKQKSPQEKDEIIEEINYFIISKINKTIDSKLKALTQYKVLLPEQLSKKLTNSTIEYNKFGITLIAHDHYLTNDFDKDLRRLNALYINNAFSGKDKLKTTFLSALQKALINKINCGSKSYKINNHSKLETIIDNKISFFYSKESTDFFLASNNYIKLLNLLSSEVNFHLNEKNYILATISMSNFDDIYSIFKKKASSRLNTINEDERIFLEKISPFNFKSKIIDFPRELQDDLKDLVNILEFNEIYKAYYRFDIESKKNIGNTQIRLNGGIALSQDEYKLRYKLYPYIYFILGNEVLIEQYTEVQSLFGTNIINSIEHYLSQNFFYVNKIDLFILIKYCDNNKIKEIILKIAKNKEKIDIKSMDKKQIHHIKKYLLNTLKNISYLILLKDENYTETTATDNWFNNLLVILGGVNWSQNQLRIIINNLMPLLERKTTNLATYENTVYFLSLNALLYQKSHSSIFKILDVTLEKIVTKRLNGYDTCIINSSYLYSIFNLSLNHEITYDNIKLLNLVLSEVQNYNNEDKKIIIINLLLNIKKVGSSEIIEAIDKFIKKNINIFNQSTITAKDIIEYLNLVKHGYLISERLPDIINQFISDNIPDKISDFNFIESGFEEIFPKLTEFLINEKGFVEFQDTLDYFNKKMAYLINESNLG